MSTEEIIRKIALKQIPRGWKFDNNKLGWSTPSGKKFIGALEIEEWLGDHTCAICGDGPDLDIRWLRIACFYDLSEISDKFRLSEDKKLYLLPFCKPCRGHFMSEILGKWINSKGHKEHPNWNGKNLIQFV